VERSGSGEIPERVEGVEGVDRRERTRRRSLVKRVLLASAVLAGYVVLAFSLFHQAWANPTHRLVGACCDSAAYVDTFRFTGNAVAHLHNPLVSPLLNAPDRINVMWQPNVMPAIGLVVSPLEVLVGPMVTYDIVMTLAVALSAFAAYLVLRHFVGGILGPVTGGLLFGFSPVETAHSLGHPQITCAFLIPLVIFLVAEICARQRLKWWLSGFLLGLALVAQLLMGEEIFAGVVFMSIALIVVLVARFHRQFISHLRYAIRALVAAAVTFGVLGAWPIYVQLFGPERLNGPVHKGSLFATNLAAYVVPVPQTTELSTGWTVHAADTWFASIGFSETNAYLGLPLVCVIVAAVILLRKRPLVQVTLATTLIMAVLGLGSSLVIGSRVYDVWLPWRAIHGLPLFDNLQANRLAMFVDLGIATIVAIALRSSAAIIGAPPRRVLARNYVSMGLRVGRRACGAFGVMAICLALVPLLPTFHYQEYTPTVPTFFTSSQVDQIPQDAVVLAIPYPRGTFGNDADMVWQAESALRFRMVGGGVYIPAGASGTINTFGGAPTVLTDVMGAIGSGRGAPAQTTAVIEAERQNLSHWNVDDVVIGPMKHEIRAVAVMTDVTGAKPVKEGGIYLWTSVDDNRFVAVTASVRTTRLRDGAVA
jgi:hypothetical protein